MGYDELLREALATPFEGWDFAVFDGRMTTAGDLRGRPLRATARRFALVARHHRR
ncbi:hypothetical protein [Nonomuraea sp. B1E8]|uniref:hypothetical protein n=1 Tax=unclassified Nonomuraea TaxID=2593643 RepID=UPI00325EA2EA